jgi:hypothetical protein
MQTNAYQREMQPTPAAQHTVCVRQSKEGHANRCSSAWVEIVYHSHTPQIPVNFRTVLTNEPS